MKENWSTESYAIMPPINPLSTTEQAGKAGNVFPTLWYSVCVVCRCFQNLLKIGGAVKAEKDNLRKYIQY
jgi:hypothetical protein